MQGASLLIINYSDLLTSTLNIQVHRLLRGVSLTAFVSDALKLKCHHHLQVACAYGGMHQLFHCQSLAETQYSSYRLAELKKQV